MTKPLFICLGALYNHQNHWAENMMQCFMDQDYEGDAELYLLDDRPGYTKYAYKTLVKQTNRTIVHITYPDRFAGLMLKYDQGIKEAAVDGLVCNPYVSVWDDDDGYLPHFLSGHAEVLAEHPWSYPENVYSTYGGKFQIECACGRFWASSAYRMDALEAIGGFGTCTEQFFDQQFLARLRAHFGDTVHGTTSPSYVYNWELSGDAHTSYYMDGNGDSWYRNTQPTPIPTGPLVPRYNDRYLRLLEMYRVFSA